MSDEPVRQRLSDDELVERVRAGSADAVAALFERHHLALLSFCRHMLGRREAAEAVVVESFHQALATLRKHDRPVHFAALLFAIARNRCHAGAGVGAERTIETLGLDPEVARDDALTALLGKLGNLPPDQRAALLLSELGRHSHEDIAAIVGCPGEKVDALVAAARTSLAGGEEAGEWSCAQARTDLAAGGGAPRREAARRHLVECAACVDFGEALRALRRALAIVLSVVPSDRLRAPDTESSARSSERPPAAPDEPPGRHINHAAAAIAGAVAVLLAAAIFLALGLVHRDVPTPGAVAPSAAGAAAPKAKGTASGRGHGASGAGVATGQGAGGLIVRTARTARRIADAAPAR
ncbi:MAG TPA: RNA polymerase sigma factor [Solirubrobacteraceae bacterium]|jgi:DNA-directed RNA polymerase specialized sigma24 family protein